MSEREREREKEKLFFRVCQLTNITEMTEYYHFATVIAVSWSNIVNGCF